MLLLVEWMRRKGRDEGAEGSLKRPARSSEREAFQVAVEEGGGKDKDVGECSTP